MTCVQSDKTIKNSTFIFKSKQNIKIKNLIIKIETKVEDNYKVISKLGKEAFGSVYKVSYFDTVIIRAMKVTKKSLANLQGDGNSFSKEIEILIQLEHPHIIERKYFIDEINYYLITEYFSGGKLYEVISSYTDFNEYKVQYLMHQILQAINYLHNNSIVHPDLKPENILFEKVMKDDKSDIINIKIIDFSTSNYFSSYQNLTLKAA